MKRHTKGKKPLFVQSVKAIKQLLTEKGDINAKIINEHKIVVKDSREVSYGMEADIEISKGRIKGLAIAKIWGPSKSATKKNRCTIIISRYPNFDPNFATKLSRKVIRPLLESYLKGQGWKDLMKKSSIVIKDRTKCTDCEKSFGNRYLKTHMVKMHNNTCNICNTTFESVVKLNNHMMQTHRQNIIPNVKNSTKPPIVLKVQKEKGVINTVNMVNKHMCKQCNNSFNANLELIEHNKNVHIHDTWPDSGSKRDLSMVKTSSVSEPKKKKAAEEQDMIERSNNMDRKILEKRKKEELEEEVRNKELQERKRREEQKSELEKKKLKFVKEKENSKIEKVNNDTKMPSNVKELPQCVRTLYPDSLQFCVSGDGACCLNCLAAWILLDVTQAPQLSRDFNTHLAEYREYYLQKLVFPLTIIIAGGERKRFNKGEENDFFDMLVTSPEACFMWRGSADIIGLTNFTQMKIEIAIYNQHTNMVEEVQKYEPDQSFPWKSEDINVPKPNQYTDMKMINYKNTHFDLIVKKGQPLLGQVNTNKGGQVESLEGARSQEADENRHEVQLTKVRRENTNTGTQNPTHNTTLNTTLNTTKSTTNNPANNNFPCAHCRKKFLDKTESNEHIKREHKDEYILMLENKLKESEDQVYQLVEDIEKVRIENKELKTIKNIDRSAKKQSPGDIYDNEDVIELDSEKELLKGKQSGLRREGPQVQSVQTFPCTVCGFKLNDQTQLNNHLKSHQDFRKICKKCGETFKNASDLEFHSTYEHSDLSQWNCMQCPFQANNKDLLKNHINFKHMQDSDKVVLSCEKCKMQFRSTWHLRNHKRDDHGKEEECVHYKENRCKFGSSCWKVHTENTGIKTFTCYSCKEIFQTMNELMSHRKKKHIELCKPCNPKQGVCRFKDQPERCWFTHQVFQQAMNYQVPP